MTYTVPPKPLPPKTRLERVTDAAEIEGIIRGALRDPIGGHFEGQWYATADSLAQFRKAAPYKVKA